MPESRDAATAGSGAGAPRPGRLAAPGPTPATPPPTGELLPGLAEVLAEERFAPRERPLQVAGHRLLGEVGRGGMGVVYRALQPCPRREVALKLVRPSRGGPRTWRRLQREIELHGRLSHPGIVTVLQAGVEPDGAPWLTMELVDGCCLSDHLREQRPDLGARLDLAAQVLDALAHAHERGVVHGDLSPANVLVDRSGRARVIDFGLARALGLAGPGPVGAEDSPTLAGTLPFLAPEQAASGDQPVDERTDVYGLGALLYLLVCGRPPLDPQALPRRAALEVLGRCEPAPPRHWNPSLGAALEGVVLTALRRDPGRRFPTVRAFARALSACPELAGAGPRRRRPRAGTDGLPGARVERRRRQQGRRARRGAGSPWALLPWRVTATLGVLLGLAGGGLLSGTRLGTADQELAFHARHGLGRVSAEERRLHLAWAARSWAKEPDRQARCLMTLGQDLARLGEPRAARELWTRAGSLLEDRDDAWSQALAGSLTRALDQLDTAAPATPPVAAVDPGRARPGRPRQAARPLLAASAGTGSPLRGAPDPAHETGRDRGTGAPHPRGPGAAQGPDHPAGRTATAGLSASRPLPGGWTGDGTQGAAAEGRWPSLPAPAAAAGSGGRTRRGLRPVPRAQRPAPTVASGEGLQLLRLLAASLLQQRLASGRADQPAQLAGHLSALARGDLAPEAVVLWALTGWSGPSAPAPAAAWAGAWSQQTAGPSGLPSPWSGLVAAP